MQVALFLSGEILLLNGCLSKLASVSLFPIGCGYIQECMVYSQKLFAVD